MIVNAEDQKALRQALFSGQMDIGFFHNQLQALSKKESRHPAYKVNFQGATKPNTKGFSKIRRKTEN